MTCSFIDGFFGIASYFFSTLNLPIVDPCQKFIFEEIDFSALSATRNLS